MILETLAQYPTLTAARLLAMARVRGYTGGDSQFRAHVAQLRPRRRAEAYLRLGGLVGNEVLMPRRLRRALRIHFVVETPQRVSEQQKRG